MSAFLNRIRMPSRRVPFGRAAVHSLLLACMGLLLGAGCKILDIFTTNLGNLFSQMSIWIFLCTLISIYSSTPARAAFNVFLFCAGMLCSYYVTAEVTASVYSRIFVYGWAVFSLFSPLLAMIVWYAKGKGWMANLLASGVIAAILILAFLLFDKIRISDVVIAAATAFFLLKK